MLIYVQSAVAVLLVVVILLQQRGQALGSAFGRGEGGGFYATKRGLEKKLYWATIILGASFLLLSLLNIVL